MKDIETETDRQRQRETERDRQTKEGIDGGQHPAVDGRSLGEK